MAARIGPYELVGEIARGALGVVHRARDPRTGRIVALKLLLTARQDGLGRRRFEREVETLLRLRHSHLVPLLDAGEERGRPWLALELIEGGTLQARLERDGPLPPAQAAELVRKLALALHACHRQGVVHRDVKPENVLLDLLGEPRLTDFGLAQLLDPEASRLTASGVAAGTPGYWAPEQAFAEREQTGPRTDVFGLGATLHALLTGAPPHQGEGLAQVLASLERPVAPPSTRRPGVPPALDAIVLRCLARSPAERYPTAAALADDLGRALGGLAPSRARGRRAPGRAGAALLLLLAVAAAGLTAWGTSPGLAPEGEVEDEVACACERWSAGLEEHGAPPLPGAAATVELDLEQVAAAGGLLRVPPGSRPPGSTVRLRVRPGTLAWSDPRPLSLEDDDVLLDLTGVRIEAAGLARGPQGQGLLLLGRRRVEVRGGELLGFAQGVHVERCEAVRLDGQRLEAAAPEQGGERYGVRVDHSSRITVHAVRSRGARVGVMLDHCHASRVQHCDLRWPAADAMGVSLSRSHGCLVLDNALEGCHGGVVLFRGAAGNLVAWNGAAGCRAAGLAVAEGGPAGEGNLVAWNDLSSAGLMSVSGHECCGLVLHGNALSGGRQAGVIRGAPEVRLVGNLVADNAAGGLTLERVAVAALRENRVRGNGGAGVSLTWPQGAPPQGGPRLELVHNDFSAPGQVHVRAEAGRVVARENRFLGGPALGLHGQASLETLEQNALLLPLPDEDLARGGALLSSVAVPDDGMARAVDGDLWTEWDVSGAVFRPGSWLLLDLGRPVAMGATVLVPWRGNTNDFPHSYELSGSLTGDLTGDDWVPLAARDGGENQRWHAHAFAPRSLRFLRLVSREERAWVRLQEWLVFADPAAAARFQEPWLELARGEPLAPGANWFGVPDPPPALLSRVRLLPPALGPSDSLEDERRALARLVRPAPPLGSPPAAFGLSARPPEVEASGAPLPPPRAAWWLRRALALGAAPPPDPQGERGALLRRPLLVSRLGRDPADPCQVTAWLEAPGIAPGEDPAALRPLGAFPWRLRAQGRVLASGRWLPDGAAPWRLEIRLPAAPAQGTALELELPGVDTLSLPAGARPLRVLVERALWERWSALPWSPALELRLCLPPGSWLEELGPWPGGPTPPSRGEARLLFLRAPAPDAPTPPGATPVELPGAPGEVEFTRALRAALSR